MDKMVKQLFSTAFSAVVFLALPPVDLSRVEAWMVVMYAYAVGLVIAYQTEELLTRRKRRRAQTRLRAAGRNKKWENSHTRR